MTEDDLQDAIESIRDSLHAIDHADDAPFEAFKQAQQAYFTLRWRERALADEFPVERFQPHGHSKNPKDGTVRVFGGVKVADPRNPTTEIAVTIDHIIDADGTVEVQVNGDPLPLVGEERASMA